MQAFGALVAKYQDRILNMVFRMCGRRADAEELAGDVPESPRTDRAVPRTEPILHLAVPDRGEPDDLHRRRGGRVRFQSLSGPEEFEQSQADALKAAVARKRSPAPEAAAVAAETGRRVMEALEELDDEFRLVVVLSDMEEMDYAQISDVLGVPIGTVKSRLHRARCILKDKLADLRVDQ